MKKSDMNKRLRELKKHFEEELEPVVDEITRLNCQIAELSAQLERLRPLHLRLSDRLDGIDSLLDYLDDLPGREFEQRQDFFIKQLTQLEGKP